MCGITGVYEYGTREGSVSRELLERMRDTLEHRGPDGAGLFLSEDRRAGLAHRRLAIVDIAGGVQPMYGEHGACLVCNGEIYNYPRLRSELEAGGARFQSSCDNEVVLRLYERHGARCVDFLSGMFAFAIWDPARRTLLLARDRAGEKPLYFSDRGGRLVFGSEIKALLEHPAIQPELDRRALASYLAHLVAPTPQTLFRGIHKLAPGEIAICDERGVRVSRYWSVFSPRRWNRVGAHEAQQTLRALLERSLRERLMSDVPVGLLLSGGIDSTALLALLHDRGRGVATFSVGFEGEPAVDERDHARRVARHFGSDHHEVHFGERDALAFLPRLVHHLDEPLGDPVALPIHFVSSLAAREGVKVVLGGEGSDELLWGYPRYEKIARWWPALRLARLAPRFMRVLAARAIPPSRAPLLRDFAEGLAEARMPPMHMPAGVPRHQRAQLLGDEPDDAWRAGGDGARGARGGGAHGGGAFEQLAFDTQEYELAVRLPERLLMRLDRLTMANGVEARAPFLDHDLIEFAYRVPPSVKLQGRETKAILRRAVADVVPAWVLSRRKHGFEAPVAQWLGARAGELLRVLAREDALRSCFDERALDELLRRRPIPARLGTVCWCLLSFALWHAAWIEGREVQPLLERAQAVR